MLQVIFPNISKNLRTVSNLNDIRHILPLKGWHAHWQLKPLRSLAAQLPFMLDYTVQKSARAHLTPRIHICRPVKHCQTDRSYSKHSETINHRTWAPAGVPPAPLRGHAKYMQSQMGLNKLQLGVQECRLKALLNKLWGLCSAKLALLQCEHRVETRDNV